MKEKALGELKLCSLSFSVLSFLQGVILLGLGARVLENGEALNQGLGHESCTRSWDFRVCRACLQSSPQWGLNGPSFPPSMGSRVICPAVTSHNDILLLCLSSLSFFFFPIEFFGNSTICSTPNKFSTWTMGGLLQGMENNPYSLFLPLPFGL